MLQEDKLGFKIQLFENIRGFLLQEVESVSLEMNKILASAKEEDKSSMGDKYETGRAMAHLELEKLGLQLENKKLMLASLQRIKIEPLKTTVEPGAVIETTIGTFFLSVQGPEFNVDSKKVTPVSMQSPLGKSLWGNAVGALVKVNGREIAIKDVY
jgi:hypothetical protein